MPLGFIKPGQEASIHPSALDVAWVAGLFEGEGTAGRSGGSNGSGTEHVSIAQKDREILDRCKGLFGGNVHSGGNVWHWRASGARGRGFLMTIYPFLSQRRKVQAKLALGL